MSPIGLEPFRNGGRVNMGAYGATPQASKSWFAGRECEVVSVGDINGDCALDFNDFVALARNWMREQPCTGCR